MSCQNVRVRHWTWSYQHKDWIQQFIRTKTNLLNFIHESTHSTRRSPGTYNLTPIWAKNRNSGSSNRNSYIKIVQGVWKQTVGVTIARLLFTDLFSVDRLILARSSFPFWNRNTWKNESIALARLRAWISKGAKYFRYKSFALFLFVLRLRSAEVAHIHTAACFQFYVWF